MKASGSRGLSFRLSNHSVAGGLPEAQLGCAAQIAAAESTVAVD